MRLGLFFKFVNWILPKCCMLFSQFQSLSVTNIDYREKARRWQTLSSRMPEIKKKKPQNKCFWNIVESKAEVNRGQQALSCVTGEWILTDYCQHFEQSRHIKALLGATGQTELPTIPWAIDTWMKSSDAGMHRSDVWYWPDPDADGSADSPLENVRISLLRTKHLIVLFYWSQILQSASNQFCGFFFLIFKLSLN